MQTKINAGTIKLAVLLTCFNRKKYTLECLTALYKQIIEPRVSFSVYLVDDGSTDGTAEAVCSEFPLVNIIKGDGTLFWNGGMRLAFTEASKENFDFYLWLNDDTLLMPDAIKEMLSTVEAVLKTDDSSVPLDLRSHAIIVGAIHDPETGEGTYGGHIRIGKWHPLKYRMVEPNGKPQLCQMMNGNSVLIPRSVFERIGNLDVGFSHSYGDFDYALRANQNNCSVWSTSKYLGTCKRNPHQSQVWTNPNLTLKERFEQINRPKGLPYYEHYIFTRRHAGFFWPFFWILPYIRLVLAAFSKN